jgi:integrative and conjugative element protein (TIGR02256 family)
MAQIELFSSGQTEIARDAVSPAIQSALAVVEAYPRVEAVRLVMWNDDYVAISVSVEVDRPSRSTPSGADIRHREPLLFLLEKTMFPYSAPIALSDRRDFPNDLPHLNPVSAGKPQSFCLHRGSLDTWFAEHTMGELVDRARQWLHDAAHGALIREEDRFEVTRVVNPVGSAVYPYQEFVEYATGEHNADHQVVMLLEYAGSQSLFNAKGYALHHQSFLNPTAYEHVRELMSKVNDLQKELNREEKNFCGLMVWPDLSIVNHKYFGVLPDTYGELIEFANVIGVALEPRIQEFMNSGLGLLLGIPIFIVIPRPQPLIGKTSNLEILSFIVLHNGEGMTIAHDAKVFALRQVEPMTPASARSLSHRGELPPEPRVMMFGVGALGSKIALHRGRGGDDALTLVDTDSVAPHNLVRHALLRDSLGKNKGLAVREAIGNLFQGGTDRTGVQALERSAFEVLAAGPDGDLAGHKIILDCTAEQSVLHAISEATLPEACRVVRAEIGDQGRLGFWLAEGPNRAPRIDDLQILLFAEAMRDDMMANWLKIHREERENLVGPALEEIALGVSCSTTTLRLADDVISYHAAGISLAIRELPEAGEVGISSWSGVGGTLGAVRRTTMSPTVVRQPTEAPEWQVRFLGPAVDFMRTEFLKAGHNETGGVLFGRIDAKRKIVYVALASPAPPDSVGRAFVFHRGVAQLPREVERVYQRTGGLLDYIGEWHTHPRGNGNLSLTDQVTADELQDIHRADRFPTLIVIVTPRDFTPHLFLP